MTSRSLDSPHPISIAPAAPLHSMESIFVSSNPTPPLLDAPAGISLASIPARAFESISLISISIEHRRTPQLISKPTPPGEMATPISPASISVATTPPIGNPYPKCQSAMAHASPTIPGIPAVLHNCSGLRSSVWTAKCSASAISNASASIPPCFEIRILPSASTLRCSRHEALMHES